MIYSTIFFKFSTFYYFFICLDFKPNFLICLLTSTLILFFCIIHITLVFFKFHEYNSKNIITHYFSSFFRIRKRFFHNWLFSCKRIWDTLPKLFYQNNFL